MPLLEITRVTKAYVRPGGKGGDAGDGRTRVLDVAAFPVKSEHSGDEVMVSVVMREGQTLTEADLIVRVSGPHVPPHIELLGGVIYLENPREMQEELRKVMAVTAEQVMSTEVVTVEADTTVQQVADLMVKRKLNRVPVVSAGQLVGIITRHDLIETLITEA